MSTTIMGYCVAHGVVEMRKNSNINTIFLPYFQTYYNYDYRNLSKLISAYTKDLLAHATNFFKQSSIPGP